jgi:DNA polymerase I-like protein with 3'-5' exonuclease and polymerase domains
VSDLALQLNMFTPPSNWKKPSQLPDLRGKIKRMAIDTEGRDDGLTEGRGSSWPTRGGFICGVSAAWREGEEVKRFYAPTRHPESDCFSVDQVRRWVADHAAAGIELIFHHGSHDMGWMTTTWDMSFKNAQVTDTQAMATLVDENMLSYSLDRLCAWRKVKGKDETDLKMSLGKSGKGAIWRLTAKEVGPYAEQDAVSTLELAESLEKEIIAQDLGEALRLENDLMPLVLEMRRRGIAVDTDKTEYRRMRILRERDRVLSRLARKLGRPSVSIEDCRSPIKLARIFEAEGVDVPYRTEKTGKPSFKATWMREHPHFLPRFVAKAEQLTEMADKFLKNFILEYQENGRIHASINQFRSEEGGTRSSRFSYSDPALQQAPHRDPRWSRAFRGVFLPEAGEQWLSTDYSQQEYRLIVHYAATMNMSKAGAAAEQYAKDPDTDFHKLVAQWTGLERKRAKDTNFAKAYGAGIAQFAAMIKSSEERAKEIMAQYDAEMPFVAQLNRFCGKLAGDRGYIKLLDGARSHFDAWEPADGFQGSMPSLGAAKAKWPGARLRRAYTHKALNRLIQGSAARQTKMWMRAVWQEGFVPLIQMHDELGFSVSSPDQVERIRQIGCEVVPLRVPMKIDAALGANWGDAE